MDDDQSWECQGRNELGQFGNGTCNDTDDDGRFGRIVDGVIGNLPATLRSRWDGMLSRGLAERTADLLGRLSKSSGLDAATFRERFLPDTVGEIAAVRIQAAARAAVAAGTPDGMRNAGAALADAVQAVGLDGWSRFVAGVENKSVDLASSTAVAQSQRSPDPVKDAIYPDYSIEELGVIVMADIAAGATAAARTAARIALGAVIRHITPGPKPPETPNVPPNSTAKAPSGATPPNKFTMPRDRQERMLELHRPGAKVATKSEFPAGWSDERISSSVEDVANDTDSITVFQKDGRQLKIGRRDGVDIQVVIGRDGHTIVSAYPTNSSRIGP